MAGDIGESTAVLVEPAPHNYGTQTSSLDVMKEPMKLTKDRMENLQKLCMCILVVELCERLAFYTFTGTQEFYLEKNGYSLAQAGGINSSMSTLCMAWAIFAGWVADCRLGRYHTIVAFGLLYALGAMLATTAAWPSVSDTRLYMFGTMLLLPMGTAGIKANISNLGADQYDTNDPVQAQAQDKFFSWFYLSINVGSAVAYGFLTTLGSNGGMGIPKDYGYFAAYAVATLCMLVAVAVFVSNRRSYKVAPVRQTSALEGVARYVLASANAGNMSALNLILGAVLLAGAIILSVLSSLSPIGSRQMASVACLCAICGIAAVILPCMDPAWIGAADLPRASLTPSEVYGFLRLLPVLFTANLCFSPLYNSMQFWYQQQACQMNLHVPFIPTAQFAGSFFMIADCLGIVIATPIALGWVNPFLESRLSSFGHSEKFTLGVSIGGLSVMVAAGLEIVRRGTYVMSERSNCAPDGIGMSQIPAGWMVVPFFLMGIGEIYTQPVIMHFAYSQSPASTRTLATVMSLVIGAVSNSIFTIQVSALSSFVPDDLNKGHLEFGYYVNMVLAAVFYAAFLHSIRHYHASDSSLASDSPAL